MVVAVRNDFRSFAVLDQPALPRLDLREKEVLSQHPSIALLSRAFFQLYIGLGENSVKKWRSENVDRDAIVERTTIGFVESCCQMNVQELAVLNLAGPSDDLRRLITQLTEFVATPISPDVFAAYPASVQAELSGVIVFCAQRRYSAKSFNNGKSTHRSFGAGELVRDLARDLVVPVPISPESSTERLAQLDRKVIEQFLPSPPIVLRRCPKCSR